LPGSCNIYDKNMNVTKIYLVENCYGDPNKIYVGKTKNCRYRDHRKKFGNDILFTYIDEINSFKSEEWKPLEIYWIEQFKQWGFEVQNKNAGGGGPNFHKFNIKNKISKNRKNKGKKQYLQYDLKGNFIKEWKSYSDICFFYRGHSLNISKSCRLPNFQVNGCLWRYKTPNYPLKINPYIKEKRSNESRKKISMLLKNKPKPEGFGDMMREVRLGIQKPEGFGNKISKSQKGKKKTGKKFKVTQYDLEENFIKSYPDIVEAGKQTNSNPSSISKVCRGIFKQTNGFIWKYE